MNLSRRPPRSRRAVSMRLSFALLSLLVLWGSATAAQESSRRIIVVAHRGAHAAAPENTLAAIRAAIELGCDYIEVDVRTTRDGHLVLMHDGSVNRTTDGAGKIADMTLEQIRALQVGKKREGQSAGERVPTFEEVLEVYQGKMKVYVDNKAAQPKQVVEAIRAHNMLSQVVIYDSPASLREFKRVAPDIWIMPPHPGSVKGIEQLIDSLRPETLDGNAVEWTSEQVDAAHRLGVEVWVDQPSIQDTPEGIARTVAMGVDAIQTDHPRRVLELLEQMGRR